MSTKVHRTEIVRPDDATPEGDSLDLIQVGSWYWVNDVQRDGTISRWFGCVVSIGSNHAELRSPKHDNGYWHTRIHFDNFLKECEFVPNPDEVIDSNVRKLQKEVMELMMQVRDVTARLAITPHSALPSGSETMALAKLSPGNSYQSYSTDLQNAKAKLLPDLFKDLQKKHKDLASWMSAKVIPMEAQAESLHSIIGAIEDRIFSVELYAGLVEKIVRVKEGDPAPLGEKIRLMQRRCYMDEECLARYEVGGMEFKDLDAFDKWLTRKENLDRLIPFPRCMVAFKIRRNTKERETFNLIDAFRVMSLQESDKYTYLYIRNGEQLFRMETAINFDHHLFPDLQTGQLTGKLWAKMFANRVDSIITDDEYQGMLEAEDVKEWKFKHTPKKDRFWFQRETEKYEPYDKSNVHYDDISKYIADDIKRHNRIVLIIQGLLDRSPVLHPHPPWQIWTQEGFEQALELIYDEARVLVAGPKPDFEAYRKRLNASLTVGSITIGQNLQWMQAEAEKENQRRRADWRTGRDYREKVTFIPYGNPGPGSLAKVAVYTKSGKCTYEWFRRRIGPEPYRWDANYKSGPIRTTFTTTTDKLLNVSAYTPGDFRQFFDDPRTRSEYLQWASLLIEAEEYHAGNRKVGTSPEDG